MHTWIKPFWRFSLKTFQGLYSFGQSNKIDLSLEYFENFRLMKGSWLLRKAWKIYQSTYSQIYSKYAELFDNEILKPRNSSDCFEKIIFFWKKIFRSPTAKLSSNNNTHNIPIRLHRQWKPKFWFRVNFPVHWNYHKTNEFFQIFIAKRFVQSLRVQN